MSLSAREQEALGRIAHELASSDSNLAAMLDTFTRLTTGEQMPEGERVKQAPRWVRRARKRRSRVRPRYAGHGAPHGLPWLPAAVILMVTAVIAITAALSGGGKTEGCAHMSGLTCLSQVHAYPPARLQAG